MPRDMTVKLKARDKPEKRMNKLKQGRRRCARQHKEAWARYESNLAEYNKRRSEWEAEERRAAAKTRDSPYANI
jgi:hypothetical protein